MIKSILIKNYQSHKDTFIQFKDGLNVITGASDSGKSVVLRAFRWVKDNRPLGDEIRNWDAKNDDPVIVEIDVDGVIVGKERKKKKTIYYLIENGDQQTFEAVDKDVPEPITKALNLSNINVQSQHDKYFLLDSGISAGEVAKKFNEMVGLDVIDKTFKNFSSNISKTKSELEYAEKEIKRTDQEIKKLSFVDQFKVKFQELKKKESLINQSKEKRNEVFSYLQRGKAIRKQIDRIKFLLQFETNINNLIKKQNEIEKEQKQFNTINALFTNGVHIEEQLSRSQILFGYEKPIAQLVEKGKEINGLETKISFVKDKVHSLTNIEKLIVKSETEMKKNIETLNRQLISLKVCPLCGETLTKQKINHILSA